MLLELGMLLLSCAAAALIFLWTVIFVDLG